MSFIILDRDGVINYDSDYYIKSPDEWQPIPGSLDAIALLNRRGFRVVVATNQSGIGRGYYDVKTLSLIHDKLFRELAAVGGHIDEVFFCPHVPDDQCFCRKPNPGLLCQIEQKYDINLKDTFFIGDSIVDVKAAQTVGCKPLLVLTGKGRQSLAAYPELLLVENFSNLASAVQYVISDQSKKIKQ